MRRRRGVPRDTNENRVEVSPMLTRDKLTIVQWQAVRNTPHHVIIAVSS
jgi:hypothetical protein